jgi:hypothetical protein
MVVANAKTNVTEAYSQQANVASSTTGEARDILQKGNGSTENSNGTKNNPAKGMASPAAAAHQPTCSEHHQNNPDDHQPSPPMLNQQQQQQQQ